MAKHNCTSLYEKNAFAKIVAFLSPLLLTAATLAAVSYGLFITEQAGRAEGVKLLEESIRSAVIKCYAVEGRYPGSLEYIENNYGVYIDKNRYFVDYDIFASNIAPYIRVIDISNSRPNNA
jgi:hypothetical protein